jgi:hypothetical protein
MLAAVLLPIALSAPGLAAPAQTDAPAVVAAQRVLVSDLSSSLPHTPLGAWLRGVAPADSSLTWEASDCGEQTGNPAVDHARDLPLCASVDVALAGGRRLSLSFLVGTSRQGISGRPALYYGVFEDATGAAPARPSATIELRDLAEVPGFMTETAHVAQATRWAAAIHTGMTRGDVERRLGHPPIQGGISAPAHTRYYVGWNLTIDVPYQGDAPSARVNGAATVVRQPRTMD